MMNDANEISHQTKLYGFIGEEAGKSSLSASMNRLFKAKNKDAMTIPMNIRKDDFYFTVSNIKKSHVNGAIISNEFTSSVIDLLDDSSNEVIKSGFCDILVRDGEKLIGDIFSIKVLIDFLISQNVKKIALIGITPHVKAFILLAKSNDFEINYFNDDLEELVKITTDMEIKNADINRIAPQMSVDLSNFDTVLNFSDLKNLEMIERLAKLNLDMKQKTQFSALKNRANELDGNYISFDDMLEDVSQSAYDYFEKKGHLDYDKSDMRF